MSKSQSGGFNILDMMNPAEVVYKIANKANDLSNKVSLGDIIKMADVSRKFLPDPKKSFTRSYNFWKKNNSSKY